MTTQYILPKQRTSRSTKRTKEFYEPTANYWIGQSDTTLATESNNRLNIMTGNINLDDYKKVLNPYNAVDEKFTRFPADMRNYDIMKDVVRRFMGEFVKQPFEFQVKSNDIDVINRFNDKLAEDVTKLAIESYMSILEAQAKQAQGQQVEVPQPPDFQKFFDEFKDNYQDDLAIAGQNVLDAIIDWTNTHILNYTAFYNYIVCGVTYSYRDIRNGVLHKETISPLEYRPISNGQAFVEDHDAGVREFRVSYHQILELFSDILSKETKDKIEHYLKDYTSGGKVVVPMAVMKSILGEEVYNTFSTDNSLLSSMDKSGYAMTRSDMTMSAYHTVFKTEVKVASVSRLDPVTGNMLVDELEVDNYTLNPEIGDISVEYNWIEEAWEVYRFGNEYDGIFSVPRPIAYQRRDFNGRCKLPYNGISEIVPNTGFVFSIPDAILPFQIARNIFAYYREKTIAKNKGAMLVLPKSIMGSSKADREEFIYRMEASSIIAYDDSEDDGGLKNQQIRGVDVNLSQFVAHITEIMETVKSEAWDTVDMNPQRYGDISTSAGKGTTQEAIVRSSMGSVIIYTMFEKYLEKDYEADLDYAKVMGATGNLVGGYTDSNSKNRLLDIDIDQFILSSLGVNVESSFKIAEKKRKLDDIAFAASQNGDVTLAIESVLSNNIATIKKAFKEFHKAKEEYERSVATEKEQLNLRAAETTAKDNQAERDTKLAIANIKEEGDNSRALIDAELKILELEINAEGSEEGMSDDISSQIDGAKQDIEQRKLALAERKQAEDSRLKDKAIDTQYKIAKENKNKYDAKK